MVPGLAPGQPKGSGPRDFCPGRRRSAAPGGAYRTRTLTVARGVLGWLDRQSAPLLLAATTAGLAVGGLAYLAGAGGAADLAWLATAACGLGYALWIAAASLRRGRLSVDVIALLALA